MPGQNNHIVSDMKFRFITYTRVQFGLLWIGISDWQLLTFIVNSFVINTIMNNAVCC